MPRPRRRRHRRCFGPRGASASSEAADVVMVVDRFDRVSEAIASPARARIAIETSSPGWPVRPRHGLCGLRLADAWWREH